MSRPERSPEDILQDLMEELLAKVEASSSADAIAYAEELLMIYDRLKGGCHE